MTANTGFDFERVPTLTAAERSHLGVLRVDLRDVGDPLAQHVHGDLVTVLVLPVGGFVASSLHLRSTVGCAGRRVQAREGREGGFPGERSWRQRQIVQTKTVPKLLSGWRSQGAGNWIIYFYFFESL